MTASATSQTEGCVKCRRVHGGFLALSLCNLFSSIFDLFQQGYNSGSILLYPLLSQKVEVIQKFGSLLNASFPDAFQGRNLLLNVRDLLL